MNADERRFFDSLTVYSGSGSFYVPEPSAIALLAVMILGVVGVFQRRLASHR
jgi:hypothetical protein